MRFTRLLVVLVLVLPTIVTAQFTDDFNRADEGLDVSVNWTKDGGAGGSEYEIVSNELAFVGGSGARRGYRAPDQGSADMYVQASLAGLVSARGGKTTQQIALRYQDEANFIGLGVSPGNTPNCGQMVAGVWTAYDEIVNPGGTDVIAVRLEASGTSVKCFYDNGSGFVEFHDEVVTTVFLTETDGGLIANENSTDPTWDDFEIGVLGAVVDWVANIESHFDVDFFADGTTYYFNSDNSGSSSGTGLSDANAFYTCSQVDAKSFVAGDQLLFMEDQATTCNAKIKNDSMVGDGTGNPFYIGVYHMDGSETPGFSGGPYTNTPGGRACLDGLDEADWDYFGGMTQTDLQNLEPPVTGNPMQQGVLEGLLNWYRSSDYDLDLYIEDICVRYTGGRAFRFTQTGSAQAEWLYVKNVYIQGTMTQGFHVSGVYNFIVEDIWVTQTDAEHEYGTAPGNLQACVAFKGTTNDPDRPVNGVFRRGVVWDSYCSEGVQSNSGGRKILIEDYAIIDAGHVAGIYLDRTHDMTVRRNFILHTNRTAFEPPGGTLDWGGIVVQNEESCGSFDWCSTYNTPADFAEYATQRATIEYNIVTGWRYGMTFQSQASGKSPNTHLGEAHGAGVYFYNNMVIDPDDIHFTINNPSPTTNYVLRTDVDPRVWGNMFINVGESGNSDVERNDTQFVAVFDRNYWSSDLTVKASYDQNMVQTGVTMPLADYRDLSTYMTTDADDWMNYTNVRAFLTTMGFDPDNIASKTLTKFKPTANVLSGLVSSSMTYPPGNASGVQVDLDIEGKAVPSSLYFGAFAGVGQTVNFIPPFIQDLSKGFGPQKSQTLSGGLE